MRKWFYDSNTGEAIIYKRDLPDLRFYDRMDLFQFDVEDLQTLNGQRIKCRAGHFVKEEANLFARAVVRALERLDAEQVLCE
jgi:hypothetical protein